MDKITLNFSTVNDVLRYLGTRPYVEVFQLIGQIQQEAQQQIGDQNGGKVDSEGN